MRYINELRENERVVEHYYCKKKSSLKSRAGKTYLSLKLQDKTGVIEAKVWDLTPDIQSFEENEYIKVDGTVLLYMNEPQLKLTKVRRSAEGEYAPADYIPCTSKNIAEMQEELRKIIASVTNPYLKKLLESIFEDNEVKSLFLKHSAAKSMHHSFMGGLLEHTISTAHITDFLCGRYSPVDRDLAVTAALLHDIGKIYELSPFPENDYTDDGRLLGHSQIGLELTAEKAAQIDKFPRGLLQLLKHCIISHHGEYIYGAARRPKIIEAFILHCADDCDAKLKAFESALAENKNNGLWLGFDKMFDRYLRKSDYKE